MGSTFNPQILVEKLAKLNSTQASIETLSHWCIFHMNKANQVVETWDRQFHCSPRDQRLALLYLANDILQNSRRKGSEFVGEFWKVLPDALRDVIRHGDEFGRNAALRLIGIWEERKVFGSRGQLLKEEIVGRHPENYSRNGKQQGLKLKQPIRNTVDKIVSGYQVVYGGQVDEDVILNQCRDAISSIEKVEKEIGEGIHSGQLQEPAFVEELQGQHTKLRGCIEQLSSVESFRESLVSNLREALQEQESKLAQIRNELQVAQSQSEQADNICQQLLNGNPVQIRAEQNSKEVHTAMAPPGFTPGDREQSAPVMYAQPASFPDKPGQNEEDARKSAAAAVAAKLTASTSSAQMLSYVLSSLASEGVIGNSSKEANGDFPSEKRPKLDSDQSSVPPQNMQQPPASSFPHPDSHQQNITTTTPQPNEPTPPPPSPPPMRPLPPVPPYQAPPYIQNAGQMTTSRFSYNLNGQPPSVPGYQVGGASVTGMSPFGSPPTNPYQSFQGSDGNFYSQQSSVLVAPPVSRQ